MTTTALEPWAVPGDDRTWIRRGTAPVKTFESDRWMRISGAGARCFRVTGARVARFHSFAFINGFHYMTGDGTSDDEVQERQRAFLAHVATFEERGTNYWLAEIRPQLNHILKELRRNRPRRPELGNLVAYLRRTAEADAVVMGDLHGRLTAAATYDWPAVFEELTGLPQADSTVLVQGLDHASARLVLKVRDAARVAQGDRELRAALADNRPPNLALGSGNSEFNRLVRLILRKYGRRTGTGYGSAATLESPTWSMEPTLLYDLISRYVEEDLDRLDRLDQDAIRQRRALQRSLRRRLSSSPATLAEFDAALRRAQGNVRMLEDHNALMEQETWGTCREALHTLAKLLVAEQLLEHIDDVFHLSLDDLSEIAARPEARVHVRDLVAGRAAEFSTQQTLSPPSLIGPGVAEQPEPPRPPAHAAAEPGDVLTGSAASPGIITGPVSVAALTTEVPNVPEGAILVARDAGPSWTPIFPLLAGIILEGGAPFQHAAIMARHYRIPAVIGVRNATVTLTAAQVVTIDGAAGTVTVKGNALTSEVAHQDN